MTGDGGLAPLPVEEWSEAARRQLPGFLRRPELYLSGRAPMPTVLGLFAHHVDLAVAWMGFTEMLAGGASTLDPRLRELAILRVAWRTGSEYEWAQHTRIGLAAGLTTEELHRVPDGAASDAWSPLDRSVLAAVDQVADDWGIAGPTWAVLAGHLDPAPLLELTFVIGGYLCFAAVLNSVGLVPDPPTEPVDAPRLPGPTAGL